MKQTTTKPAIFHDQTGRIACEKHTPFKGSDTWRWDKWRKMPAADQAAFAAATGVTVLCETCRPR